MATLTFNKFNCFSENEAEKLHNLGSDTLKVYLTNTAPVATNTVFGTPAEIAAGNGYTAGGAAVTISSSSQSSGTYTLVAGADIVWTASGGAIAQFRYAVLYNDTAAADNLIGWWDHGSALDVPNGGTYTLAFNGVTIYSKTWA